MLDTKALAQATAMIVREHVDAALEPVLLRLAALEQRETVTPVKGEPGEPGKDGRDGQDADIEAVKALALAAVAEAVPLAVQAAIEALPAPEKGDKGEAGLPGEKGEPGKDGSDGKDGVGLADAMINRSGELVLTMTDGRIKTLGSIVGRDGKDGEKGDRGEDGHDGHDVEDLTVTQDGAIVEFAFQVGDTRSIFEVELPQGPAGVNGKDAYAGEAKGLFDPAVEYRALDVVSYNGSEWRAKYDNPGEMPGPGWMLSACKGKRGDRGERGANGRDGVSPVAVYLRGTELITTLTDGAELKADLSGLSERTD